MNFIFKGLIFIILIIIFLTTSLNPFSYYSILNYKTLITHDYLPQIKNKKQK